MVHQVEKLEGDKEGLISVSFKSTRVLLLGNMGAETLNARLTLV